ncbi:MAG: hypothetical protein A2998_02815 [Candidatus Staskawiczbacteria bacterium RIFCSPLOWO2_01_FULL_37_25b]|uniref:Uncharacterized protein n=2 Tax=Parcubacteria group TaxID=1794811 RepID=A0A1F8F6M3_9BACT|nr:MAG: hypothetical protein A3C61_03020 [Candidatus Yanofskybacteria bacterium RIFCSPHIGHO2_02_FULL_39_10]OGZ71318.1 MAG: hypothetical protein A2998_02815 [Candidatus Staskawiczbacteria bacterium RIFCSPLOWO2_01_FULL_37_25b]
MKNFIKISAFTISLLFLFPVFVFGATPPGVDITLDSLLVDVQSIAGWLIIAGGILVGITIIGTGIMYLMAGGNAQRMTIAKSMFKAGIIGGLIIFSPGLIISTITGFGSNPLGFFGGSGGSGTSVDTYGCVNNSCSLVSDGIFTDNTCAGQCGSVGGQGTGEACYACINNQGGTWCFASSTCVADGLQCNGVFTELSGGCL